MSVLSAIKSRLPWWAKIAAKVALARLPLGGKAWQRLDLFAPGAMDDPDYALGVFRHHYEAAGAPAPGFAFLELGPGDSFASAVVGKAWGAARGWLVDAGAYATRDMAVYRRVLDRLVRGASEAVLVPMRRAESPEALLAAAGAVYLDGGLASLARVPAASCDFVFSQAVLEHVPRAEFAATMGEIRRILKPGGVSTHQIDFRDHLGGELNHLRFSERVWEAPWFARRSGFYTNRLRPSEMLALFARAGFEVEMRDETRWREAPLRSEQLHPAFRGCAPDDLLIRDAFVVLRRNS